MKIYGPYICKNGRKIVIVCPNGTRRSDPRITVSYPKWLMEQHLGRKLLPNETVDHINRDFTDDRLENLQVLDKLEHLQLDSKRVHPIETVCVWCGKLVLKQASVLRGNSKKGKAGPFCSSKCVGQYGSAVQSGKIERLPVQPKPTSQYYYLKK